MAARLLLQFALLAALLSTRVHALETAAEFGVQVRGSQILGPAQEDRGEVDWQARMHNWKRDSAGAQAGWLHALRDWRAAQLKQQGYVDARYRRADLAWTQRNFVQPQAMVEDRYLYDPATRRYTVARFLADLQRRYGGIDSVLLWPVYPNLGIDQRNQWDLLRDLPGGLPALRQMVREFQARGVKVFLPVLPWDEGTRDEGRPMAEAAAALLAEVEADGINGDTMEGLPADYRDAADASGRALALEPELSMKDESMLAYNQQSWAYWDTASFVPLVSKWKWLEPRHLPHVADRWATDRRDLMQAAFFNGAGIQSWENVWGWWNGITPRDAAALRRIATIYRGWPAMFASADWVPHRPTLHYGVYASEFPGGRQRLWTLVNRNDFALNGAVMRVPHAQGRRYFDLWNGRALQPRVDQGEAVLSLPLEAHGYGAVLAVDGAELGPEQAHTLATLRALARRPLASYRADWASLPQRMQPVAPTPVARELPEGMVAIPGADFDFRVGAIMIEGENRAGLGVQFPWEDSPRRGHLQRLHIKPFYIDRHPVTNAQFLAFVQATDYRPADAHNFLRHWQQGRPAQGDEQRPVTWVSLEDARAYAAWAGKRLPHDWEWQYAAQGLDGRRYPWGAHWDAAAVPTAQLGRAPVAVPLVGQHPGGASPFGVQDLVGLVWQWTDEFRDKHTRAATLRGGSFYQPQGSFWYFPQAYALDQHAKYLLMSPGKDRAGTLGFRCVKDRR